MIDASGFCVERYCHILIKMILGRKGINGRTLSNNTLFALSLS
jgi:hypothetical protein